MLIVCEIHALAEARVREFKFVLAFERGRKFRARLGDAFVVLDIEALDAAHAAGELPCERDRGGNDRRSWLANYLLE